MHKPKLWILFNIYSFIPVFVRSFCSNTMVKTRKAKKIVAEPKGENPLPPECHSAHNFTAIEIRRLRKELLCWYDKNKRELPWRTAAETETDANQRAYAVLVSEMMLQQTQVATVRAYYERWMVRWPTLPHLAAASLEEVNQMWAGLGYYSRGRRLHEIACKVQEQLGGCMPSTAQELLKLPGVGRYTAGAVASIAFSERAPLVDGNVVRVLARLRTIGACSMSPAVTRACWELAGEVLDPSRPGDFNQALMELGATVCTPKAPQCDACPLSSLCLASKRATHTARLADIEQVPGCSLCLATDKWDPKLGVTNFPRKEKKTLVSQQETAVCVLHRQTPLGTELLLEQRPSHGLLANLWQFPCVVLPLGLPDPEVLEAVRAGLAEGYGLANTQPSLLGRVAHQFSHISQVYVVLSLEAAPGEEPGRPGSSEQQQQARQWAPHHTVNSLAISTGMKKVFKLFNSRDEEAPKPPAKRRKLSQTPAEAGRTNTLLTQFFSLAKSKTKQ